MRTHIGMLVSVIVAAAGLVGAAPQAVAAPVAVAEALPAAADVQYDYGLIRKGTTLYARAATTDPWAKIATKVRKVSRADGFILVVTTSGEVRVKQNFTDTWHPVATHASDAALSSCIIVVRKGGTLYATRAVGQALQKVATSATTPKVSGCRMAYRTKGGTVWAAGPSLVFKVIATKTSGFALASDNNSNTFSTLLLIRKGSALYATRDLAVAPTAYGTSNRTPVVSGGSAVVFRNSKGEVWSRWQDGAWRDLGKADGFSVDFHRLVLRRGSALTYVDLSAEFPPSPMTIKASRTPYPFYLQLHYVSAKKKLYLSSDWVSWQLSATGVDWASFDSH